MQLHIVLKLLSKEQNHVLINAMNRPVPLSQQQKNFLRMNYAGAVSGEYNVSLFLFVVDWSPPSSMVLFLDQITKFKYSKKISIVSFLCFTPGVVPNLGRKYALCTLVATWRTQKCSYEYCYQRQFAKFHHWESSRQS